MSLIQRIFVDLKFWEECGRYGLGLWQCPKFLFVVMGFITIVAMTITHLVAVNYTEPQFVVVSVVGVAVLIFSIGNIYLFIIEIINPAKIDVVASAYTENVTNDWGSRDVLTMDKGILGFDPEAEDNFEVNLPICLVNS